LPPLVWPSSSFPASVPNFYRLAGSLSFGYSCQAGTWRVSRNRFQFGSRSPLPLKGVLKEGRWASLAAIKHGGWCKSKGQGAPPVQQSGMEVKDQNQIPPAVGSLVGGVRFPHRPTRYFIWSGQNTGTSGNEPGSVIPPP
jgi:hypothetical protein